MVHLPRHLVGKCHRRGRHAQRDFDLVSDHHVLCDRGRLGLRGDLRAGSVDVYRLSAHLERDRLASAHPLGRYLRLRLRSQRHASRGDQCGVVDAHVHDVHDGGLDLVYDQRRR